MQDLDAVIGSYTGLARKALDYTQTSKRLFDSAREPGFSAESFAALAALVDTARFERVGNFKEVMNWEQYVGFLAAWAPNARWDCSFRRVTEAPGLAVLELEERTTMGEAANVVNSVSIYEFDDQGRIIHLDIYLQMPMPDPALLQGYEGVAISG